ncbi:hypothetical protein, partial [Sulfuricurvum sp.]|uniref:beta strand repeat-containing protein n=1 Tax=Sulfuricurvum sp. TaxID=2025608 RepID=UPI00262945B8
MATAIDKIANNSLVAISGTTEQILAALKGVTGYKGDVAVTGAATLEDLTTINKATTGAITLDTAVDFVASSTEILTAIAGDINFAGLDSVTITNNNYTLAQLNTIADAGVATTVSNTSVALSGSVADLAVLGDIDNYAGTITVTGNYNLAQLKTIDTYTTGAIKLANTSVALSGTAADLAAMLPTLAGYKGAVTVDNAITLVELKAINNATTGAITLAVQTADLSGSAADILAAFKGIKSYATGDITVTGTDYKLADLKAINAITTDGALIVTTSTVALTGTAKDLVAALDGVTYAGKVTVTGSYTVADLKAINTAVSGDTVLASKNVALTGSIADIKLALAGITDYAGAIKLTDVPADTTELVSIANLTKGKITLPANGYIDLDATAAVLQPLLAKINGAYKGDVTVSSLDGNTVKALAQLKAINDATSGDVTVTAASPLEGSIKDIQAALKGITGFDAAITVTDAKYTLAQLKTIVDSMGATADTLILDVNAPLSGSVEALNAVLVKVPNTYAGDITVTGNYSLTQLKDLNTETAGTIKVANTSVALSGTAADLAAMLPTLTGYKGAVTVNNAVDLDQLLAINNATTGAITLAVQTANLSGSAADILAAFKGIKSYATGDITVDGTDYKLADLKAINAITTDGDLIVTTPIALSGTAKDLAAALNGVTGYTDVTVTGSYTVAELKAINAA